MFFYLYKVSTLKTPKGRPLVASAGTEGMQRKRNWEAYK